MISPKRHNRGRSPAPKRDAVELFRAGDLAISELSAVERTSLMAATTAKPRSRANSPKNDVAKAKFADTQFEVFITANVSNEDSAIQIVSYIRNGRAALAFSEGLVRKLMVQAETRERDDQIFQMTRQGHTGKEIAAALGMHKAHISQIQTKLAAKYGELAVGAPGSPGSAPIDPREATWKRPRHLVTDHDSGGYLRGEDARQYADDPDDPRPPLSLDALRALTDGLDRAAADDEPGPDDRR